MHGAGGGGGREGFPEFMRFPSLEGYDEAEGNVSSTGHCYGTGT